MQDAQVTKSLVVNPLFFDLYKFVSGTCLLLLGACFLISLYGLMYSLNYNFKKATYLFLFYCTTHYVC